MKDRGVKEGREGGKRDMKEEGRWEGHRWAQGGRRQWRKGRVCGKKGKGENIVCDNRGCWSAGCAGLHPANRKGA